MRGNGVWNNRTGMRKPGANAEFSSRYRFIASLLDDIVEQPRSKHWS